MKTILSSRRDHHLAKFSIFLIAVALIAGMVGCGGHPFGEDIYIETWYDLDAIRKKENLDNNHRLINDLDADTPGYTELASSEANGGRGWEPIGTSIAPFKGSFDGQDHTIMGLFIHRPSESNVGLFSSVAEGGVVQNVRVVDVAVTGHWYVGGLVGENTGTVSNSYSSGSVTGDNSVGGLVGDNTGTVSNSYSTGGSVTGDDRVGGLVGDNTGTVSNSHFRGNVISKEGSYIGGLVGINDVGTVSNSYSAGNVSGDENVGGLVGGNEKGTVSDSYSTSSVTGKGGVGGLVGRNDDKATVSDSYSAGNVNGDDGVGGLVGRNYEGTVSNSHYNYDRVLVNGKNIITIGALFDKDFDQWRDKDKFLDVNEKLSQEDDYYVVNNVTDFKELLAFGQDKSLKFRLKNDLDLATELNFYIPYFAGEFEGNGHKISNLSFNFDFVYNVGLFGYLARGGRVTQVGVENVNITGASFVGGLVGYNWEGTVSDSYSTGSMTGNADVGGLVGSNNAGKILDNCNSTGSVTGNYYVGGLVGCNYKEGKVSNSYSTGSVTGTWGTGGLVGRNQGIVEKSNSTGSVNGRVIVGDVGDVLGGLVGLNEYTVRDSYSTGSVTGDDWVGGLVGTNYDTVSDSYSTSSVSGDDWVGGLVGWNDFEGIVNKTYSTGSVSGDDWVGGLVGKDNGDVSNSFWDKDTSGIEVSDGGTGKNTTDMKDIDTFTEWEIRAVNQDETDLRYTWNIVDGEKYPFLSWES
jgi:hypothetical protein